MLGLTPPMLISRIITLMVAFTLHELAHALVADRLGDPTPRAAGRVSLNPLAHLDLMGSLLLIVAGFGWAKPVPINPSVLRRKSAGGVMWVSLAGPMTNLVLAILGAVLLRVSGVDFHAELAGFLPTPGGFLLEFIYINVALFLFNLLPVAPLDGEKVLEFLIPPQWEGIFMRLRPYGSYFLLLIVVILPRIGIDVFGMAFERPLFGLVRLLIGI